jgi:cytosine/creatinine deaminase
MSDHDTAFMEEAWHEARKGFEEGGLPIGAVLVRDGRIIGRGHNRRLQQGDPIAHGEMDCLRNADRQASYRDTTLYTSLSPCMMCAGAIVQFGIPRVVIGENRTFGGNEAFLRDRGVAVVVLEHAGCVELMRRFIEANPAVWNEDIGKG